MVYAILLTAALNLGQVSAADGPARQWHRAEINGKAEHVWGWRDRNGFIHHTYSENPHIYGTSAPTHAPLNPGQTISQDGALNNGLLLNAVRPTSGLETNDPDLASKLEQHCPNDEPQVPDMPYGPTLSVNLEQFAVPLTCLVCGLVLIIAALFANRRQ